MSTIAKPSWSSPASKFFLALWSTCQGRSPYYPWSHQDSQWFTRSPSKSSICIYMLYVFLCHLPSVEELQPSPGTTAFFQAPLHRTSSARHGAARRRWRVPGPLDSWGHTDQKNDYWHCGQNDKTWQNKIYVQPKNICQGPFSWCFMMSTMFYDVPCDLLTL